VTGRFLSEDPAGFAGSGPNYYAYVYDGPTNFVDPSGRCPWCVGAVVGGFTGAVYGAIGAMETGGDDWDWEDVAMGALLGGAVGGFTGTVNPFGAMVGGTVGNVGADVAGQGWACLPWEKPQACPETV
jgi:hypothetical protein